MPKPPNPELRHQISELVLRQVNSDGVDSISMRHLAKELNITATTLYYYYQSKEELVGLARNTAVKYLLNHITAEVNKKSKPRRRIEKFITSFIDWSIANPNLFNIIFDKQIAQKSVDEMESNYGIYLLAHELIFDGIARKDFETDNPEISANLLISSLFGIVHMQQNNILIGKTEKDKDAVMNEFIKLFVKQYLRKKKK